jgi:hypothetical protein
VTNVLPTEGKRGRQTLGVLLFLFVLTAGLSQLLGWMGWPDAIYCPVMGIVAWATPVLSMLTLACVVIFAVSLATRKFEALTGSLIAAFLFGSLPHITHTVFYAGGSSCMG